jgi:hypothetical protein
MEALLEKEGEVENWNDDRLDELSRRMDKGFEEMATKVELTGLKNEMSLRFDAVDQRFGEIDRRFDAVDRRFGEIDRRFDDVDERFGEVGKRFDKLDSQLLRLNDRLDRQNHALLVGTFGLIAAVLANGFFG